MPEEQAEPVETAMDCRSRLMRSPSPSMKRNEILERCGRRRSRSPLKTTSLISELTPSSNRSRSLRSCSTRSRQFFPREFCSRTKRDNAGHAFSAGALFSLLMSPDILRSQSARHDEQTGRRFLSARIVCVRRATANHIRAFPRQLEIRPAACTASV